MRDAIDAFRRKIRVRKMADVSLFGGVTDVIKRLSSDYGLIVISATDERSICDYLREKRLPPVNSPVFSLVVPS